MLAEVWFCWGPIFVLSLKCSPERQASPLAVTSISVCPFSQHEIPGVILILQGLRLDVPDYQKCLVQNVTSPARKVNSQGRAFSLCHTVSLSAPSIADISIPLGLRCHAVTLTLCLLPSPLPCSTSLTTLHTGFNHTVQQASVNDHALSATYNAFLLRHQRGTSPNLPTSLSGQPHIPQLRQHNSLFPELLSSSHQPSSCVFSYLFVVCPYTGPSGLFTVTAASNHST